MSKKSTIFLHLPAYREPELIPTIKDALDQAKYPKRLHFGICRQYEPSDGFDDLTEYKDNPKAIHFTNGGPWHETWSGDYSEEWIKVYDEIV